MDSVADLLAKKIPEEPESFRVIKKFVKEKYHLTVGVTTRGKDTVILAPSSALAGALRYDIAELKLLTGDDSLRIAAQ
jgi:hypothetical protein